MESRNMSEKEFQEFQRLLQKELTATDVVDTAQEDAEITEMLRREEDAPRPDASHFRQSRKTAQPEAASEAEASSPASSAPVPPMTRGKYERIPEPEEVAASAAAAQKASAPASAPESGSKAATASSASGRRSQPEQRRGRYEQVAAAPETEAAAGQPVLMPKRGTASSGRRKKRSQRSTRVARVVIGMAAVFVVGLSAGLIVNTMQAKKASTNEDADTEDAIGIETGVLENQSADGSDGGCSILTIQPLDDFVAVLEESTYPLQVSMTTQGTANARDLSWESSDPAVAEVTEDGIVRGVGAGECVLTISAKDNPEVSAQVQCAVRHLEEKDGVTYIDGIMVINKTYGAPSSFDPGRSSEAADAFASLQEAATAAGLDIYDSSDYRDYAYQDTIYNNYVDLYGWEMADTFSARPGYSEHQTGLTVDVNTIDDAFGDTEEAKWLAEHCAEYGYIVRYPADKVDVTGYKYEPWHIRYVGKEAATEMYERGLCLEEYLGITSEYAEDWE
jgi:hypothetical protein